MKGRLMRRSIQRSIYGVLVGIAIFSSGCCSNNEGEKFQARDYQQQPEEKKDLTLSEAWKKGWDSKRVLAIVKGERPDPSVYLMEEYIREHLELFDDGAVRFCSRNAIAKFGTLGPDGGFVMSKSDFDEVIEQMHGDLRGIEKKLGLDPNYLDGADVLIAYIEDPEKFGLRMPSGNEGGANDHWLPGGVTSGGVNEAVMDFSGKPSYQEIELE